MSNTLTRLALAAAILTAVPFPARGDSDEAAAAKVGAAWQAYADCLIARAVTLGRDNTESADTVLRAANAECGDEESKFRDEMLAAVVSDSWREPFIQRETRKAGDIAVMALLRARAATRNDRPD